MGYIGYIEFKQTQMTTQTFQHGNQDLIHACEWFKNTPEYQKWVFRGDWYRSLADGFHTYLDDPVSAQMVKNEWGELGLSVMVDLGIELAKKYISEL